MNKENLQDWLEMPLGSSLDVSVLMQLIRVPGGWIMVNYGYPVFVPEPPKEKVQISGRAFPTNWKGMSTYLDNL